MWGKKLFLIVEKYFTWHIISGEATKRQDQQLDCHSFKNHPRLQYGQH